MSYSFKNGWDWRTRTLQFFSNQDPPLVSFITLTLQIINNLQEKTSPNEFYNDRGNERLVRAT